MIYNVTLYIITSVACTPVSANSIRFDESDGPKSAVYRAYAYLRALCVRRTTP